MTCARKCCFDQATHYRSLVLGTSVAKTWEDTTLSADRDAYKRLKDDGIQPKGLKGAAQLEKHASSAWEIEAGRILPPDQSRRIDSANAEAQAFMGQS